MKFPVANEARSYLADRRDWTVNRANLLSVVIGGALGGTSSGLQLSTKLIKARSRGRFRSALSASLAVAGIRAQDVRAKILFLKRDLLDLEQIQPYRHNPTVYVEAIGNGLYSQFIFNYAPEATRLKQITARIEKLPAFLETAKQNLADSPGIWNQVAREENEGNLDLIDHTIRAKIPADLEPRYDRAATTAITALKSFNDYLKTGLSQHTTDWRLGALLYDDKFKFTLAIGDSPQQTLADAEAKLRSIREEMHAQAIAVYPKFFPGKTPPQDLNSVVFGGAR